MRKFLLLFSFIFVTSLAWSQDRVITGKVTSPEDGSAIPGVSVTLKGTANGTVTDSDGSYSISAPASGGTLVFSFIGLKTTEVAIGNQSTVDVALEEDISVLSEVVVTALDIKRDKASLGYATQQISGENIRVAREQNVNTALAGKIAGVQIVSGSGAKFGAPAVRIRGIRGISGGSPLYVLDGIVIDDPTSVNMDNIQNINVLKGANAAALYGNRARDGVVILSSKRGTTDAVSIDINQTTMFESVYIMPEFQNEYGGGYGPDFDTFSYDPTIHDAALAGLDGMPMPTFSADASWGPKMDGTMVAQWDSFTPGTANYGKAHPWSPQPDNIKDFYRTGVMNNTSISLGKSSEQYAINATLSKSSRTGVMENTNQDKLFLNLNFSAKLSKKLTVEGAANYNESYTKGNLDEGYNSIGSNFNQWFQRQLNMDDLKKYYKMPDGRYTSWNINSPEDSEPLYWDNPYAYLYGAYSEWDRDVLSSKFAVHYEIVKDLKASVLLTRNSRNEVFYDRRDAGLKIGPAYFRTYSNKVVEDNIQGMLSYTKQFGDFGVLANAGVNYRTNTQDYINMNTNGGLSVDELYNISASTQQPFVQNTIGKSKVNSYFASVSVDWKRIVFLDGTFRKDYDSRLPNGKNDYVYPSGSLSFVFTELTDLPWLSFGKIRASYAKVGNEVGRYVTRPTYGLGTPYGGLPNTGVPNGIIDPNLQAATTGSVEVGFELGFLENRLRTEFSFYNQDNANELLNITVPSSSGASSFLTNSIDSYTRGWELAIGGTPVKTAGGLVWDVNFNIAQNTVFINEIAAEYGLNAFAMGNGFGGTSTSGGWDGQALARRNEEWGVIVGRKIRRDDNGNVLVDDEGRPLTDANQDLGHILPDFTGGIFNRVAYKNFELAFTIDYQFGGKFLSISRMFGAYSGLTKETVGNNDKGVPQRNDPSEGGGMSFGGVFADGTPNNIYLGADDYWTTLFGVSERWMYDATFVKMRELRLGYNVPTDFLTKLKYVKGASIAFVANNPFLLYSKVDGIDPSEIGGDTVEARNNGSWVEGGNLASTRSFGFDIKLKF